MEAISQNILWEAILELRKKVTRQKEPISTYSILCYDSSFRVKLGIEAGTPDKNVIVITRLTDISVLPDTTLFHLDKRNNASLVSNGFLDETSIRFLLQYLPFSFTSEIARRQKRTYTILHLAQSIDGRIATVTGQSKWVSNKENLIHSHRMRALCDGILIGANTLKNDSPQLTVRHVKGPNPCKVIVANSPDNFKYLTKNGGKIIRFSTGKAESLKGIETISDSNNSGLIYSSFILKELYKRKIYTLFVEGGAKTASVFIKEKTADKLQLFISPLIFGSGINTFTLPVIEKVSDSVNLVNTSFRPMGDGLFFEGEFTNSNPVY